MIRINCPFCGIREHTEFTYGEDANRQTPGLSAPIEEWNTYVYERDNVAGCHMEYWHHAFGCRSWIKVKRDTQTHAILWVGLPQENPETAL